MEKILGVSFALIALVSWAFGDFFIQRSSRAVGIWKALFFIGFSGSIILFPFVLYQNHFEYIIHHLWLLFLLSVVVLFAALFDFEALRKGKISIVEPVVGFELPLTVAMSIAIGGEQLPALQWELITIIFVGIIFTVVEGADSIHKKIIFEKGFILAGLGAIGMAFTNFLIGVASRETTPLITIWFAHSMLAVFCALYFTVTKSWKTLLTDFNRHRSIILGESFCDNIAWLAYAYATTRIPTSIAVTLSESFIALAALLGIIYNREKLRKHQLIGITLTIFGVIVLAYLTSE